MSDVFRNLLTGILTAQTYLQRNDASRNAAFAYTLGRLKNVAGTNAVTADVLFDQGLTALQDGATALFLPVAENTGPMTLNVNSLGSVAIKDISGAALSGGEIVAGKAVDLKYIDDGTPHWRIVSPTNVGADKFIGLQFITSTGTYVPTTGTTSVFAIGQAPGAGGGGAKGDNTGSGDIYAGNGAAGETRIGRFDITGNVSVTIGSAGSGGSSSPSDGTNGGDLVFGAFMTCKGGTAGGRRDGTSGVSSSGSTPTGSGGFRIPPTAPTISASAHDFPSAGSCWFGVGPLQRKSSDGAGLSGSGYGAGGAGAKATDGIFTGYAGGSGAPGVLILLEFGSP